MTASIIFGCAGTAITAEERDFFRAADPLGFILFARNVETPDQVRSLVAELRRSVGRADAPVLIDQEGGRVARLKPPHWPARPPAAFFGELYRQRGRVTACEAVRLDARLIADDVYRLGIDVLCAPVLDLRYPTTHQAIGDRSFAGDPQVVTDLAASFLDGAIEGGVIPVIKHIPGHGRATRDSHFDLPVVEATADELAASDFVPFRQLAPRAWGMTAHIVYRAFDPERPATQSKIVIGDVIRGKIGFDGFLMTDDLSMNALGGDFAQRTERALGAGCDAILHCNGKMAEMTEVARASRPLSAISDERRRRIRSSPPAACDREALQATLDSLLAA
jgi:beta-N-acetylhexosaminidase